MDQTTIILQIFVPVLVFLLACGLVSAYLFDQKDRSIYWGFGLGFLLSLIGIIIAFVLPKDANPNPKRASFASEFSTMTLALIPVAIVINVVVGQIVQNVLKLPIYLDSVGTVMVGVLAGPVAGAVTGALSNIIWAILFSSPTSAPYAITAFVIGICAGIAGFYKVFRNIGLTILAGLITGAIAALVSAPITAFVFGGVTGSGTDLIIAAAQATGANLIGAATLQGFISDPLDKTISYLVVWLIVRGMSKRLISQFPRSQNVVES